MTRQPTTALTAIPTRNGACMSGATPPCLYRSYEAFAAAAVIAGVESRNEKRPAAVAVETAEEARR